ncbi:hypothetical protein GCM10009872_26980 [Actinopolymorpha rutila]
MRDTGWDLRRRRGTARSGFGRASGVAMDGFGRGGRPYDAAIARAAGRGVCAHLGVDTARPVWTTRPGKQLPGTFSGHRLCPQRGDAELAGEPPDRALSEIFSTEKSPGCAQRIPRQSPGYPQPLCTSGLPLTALHGVRSPLTSNPGRSRRTILSVVAARTVAQVFVTGGASEVVRQ